MVSTRAVKQAEVVFIAGPTATGKTGLAMQLADRFDVELINVDAAQVYRGMDIGTAKLTQEEQKRYPHQLIDIRAPWETYDAGQFRNDALKAIAAAHSAGRLPVLVGGTLFYFSALEKGVSSLPRAEAQLREEIASRAGQQGWPSLHQEMAQIDPRWAMKVQATDSQRISRAWEIYQICGEQPSAVMQREAPIPMAYPVKKFALIPSDRGQLHKQIEQRFDAMLDQGLVKEIKNLQQQEEVTNDLPAMRCVGYRQGIQHLNGAYGLSEMRERGVAATRQLAKRQLTWLRHQSGWVWLASGDKRAVDWVEGFLR